MEGISDIKIKDKDKEINEKKEKVVLNNDLTDFTEEVFEIKDIKKLFGDLKNISATKFLRDIISIVQDDKDYSAFRDINKIANLKQKFELIDVINNSEFYSFYSKSSTRLQNIISNVISKKILVFKENEILPKTLNKSYLDIVIDISAAISEDQRISALLLSAGLSLAFSKYCIKIRISVFEERNNVWILTEDFSTKNIKQQLSLLRDALSFKARFISFPADALKKLKYEFNIKYNNNYTINDENNNKYCQILISNLISSQIIDKNLNWNDLGQKIVVFGLKSVLEEDFIKENKNIYIKIY